MTRVEFNPEHLAASTSILSVVYYLHAVHIAGLSCERAGIGSVVKHSKTAVLRGCVVMCISTFVIKM